MSAEPNVIEPISLENSGFSQGQLPISPPLRCLVCSVRLISDRFIQPFQTDESPRQQKSLSTNPFMPNNQNRGKKDSVKGAISVGWTSKDAKEREKKLRLWLSPKGDDGKAGRLAGKSYEAIAAALAKHFKRKISKWSAREYVRQAWMDFDGDKPALHRGGRPKGVQRRKVKSPPPWTRPSRAKKVTPVPDEAKAQNLRDTRIGLFQEIMKVCGLSASHLHRLLKNCPDLKDSVGSKSGFHKELSASSIKPDRIRLDALPARGDLALSIHQVVLLGPGCLRVVLLACELRSLYLNAAVFEVTVPWTFFNRYLKRLQPATVRQGAPPRHFNTDQRAKLDFSSGGSGSPASVTLPQNAISDFIQKTCNELSAPVSAVFLANSLGDAGQLAAGFNGEQAACGYQVFPATKQQHLPIQSFQDWTTDKFRVELANAFNRHNQANVMHRGVHQVCNPTRLQGVWRSSTDLI